jgi:hypothetical protein
LVNRGPVHVRGGRHTFAGLLDHNERVVETDEGNNGASKQWVWHPSCLVPGTSFVRAEPPDLTGGHEYLPLYDLLYYNCDGMRVISTGWWNAYVMTPTDPGADYDFGLTYPAVGTESGFDLYLTGSVRPAGCTEVVLVNTNVTGDQTEEFDAAVYGMSGGGDYELRHVTSTGFPYGTTAALHMDEGEMLLLKEVLVHSEGVGKVSIIVDADNAGGPLQVAWFDRTLEWGGTHNAAAIGTTDSTGHVAIEADVTAMGYHGVAIYRDMTGGTGPRDLTLRVGRPPGDLAAATPPSWHAPIVPAAGPVFPYPFDEVTAPMTLIGDTAPTQYYVNLANVGFGASGDYDLSVGRDGAVTVGYNFTSLAPGQNYSFQGNFLTFPGGLHTITLQIDPAQEVFESWENNNTYGEQWAWQPPVHLADTPGYRNTPPARDGGRALLTPGAPVYDNCDGLRTERFYPADTQHWITATAIVPVSSSADYELRVYKRSDNAALGFRTPLGASGTGPGQTEFVFMPYRGVLERQWDVGVVKVAGSGSYVYETVTGPTLVSQPTGDFGPYTMGPTHLLDVCEAYFLPGQYTFTVRSDSGMVDWGFAIASSQNGYSGKMQVLDDGVVTGLVNGGGPGEDEQVSIQIAETGTYTLAVWKTGSSEIDKGGVYTLNIRPAAPSGVGDQDMPAPQSALGPVWPNPFNPSTNIAFNLARSAGVEVALYDARGHKVRTLVNGNMPAGSHDVVWDGRDELGRNAVSGVYFVSFRSGEIRETQKITLVR